MQNENSKPEYFPLDVEDFEKQRLEAEQAVIGSILIDNGVIRDILAFLRDDDFYFRQNRIIFQTIRSMFQSGESVDGLTVANRLLPMDGVDWRNYLVQLYEITPTSANVMEYAKIMRESACLANIWKNAAFLREMRSLDDCRQYAAKIVENLDNSGDSVDVWTTADILNSFYDDMNPEKASDREYISFGFPEMDKGMYIERGDVVMIGGYPSDGKTALAVQMACRMADKYRVGFFSLETRQVKIRDRMMASYLQIDFGRIKTRNLSDEEWDTAAAFHEYFLQKKLFLFNAAGYTPSKIEAVSQAYALDVAFIDYAQIVQPETRGKATEQLANVSMRLHQFAQRTGTLVIEIAQLSRKNKSEAWREPTMFDLKQTGQFEYDADLILMLFKPDPEKDADQKRHRFLSVVKNKEGESGKWALHFDGEHQSFQFITGRDDG